MGPYRTPTLKSARASKWAKPVLNPGNIYVQGCKVKTLLLTVRHLDVYFTPSLVIYWTLFTRFSEANHLIAHIFSDTRNRATALAQFGQA